MTVLLGLLLLAGTEIADLAVEAGVDAVDLEGAADTTGLEPREYLYMTGELSRPRVMDPAVERRLDCISWYESRHFPGAYNQRSRASGQYQFLPSTWAGTPQGRAGLSPFDPDAAREAARWMIGQGRVREWVPVQMGLC